MTPLTHAPTNTTEAVARVVAFFETLTPASIAQLATIYEPQAHFKDPFNDVRGVAAIGQIFSHMFDTLDRPRFTITHQVIQGQQCFLTWEFRLFFKSRQRKQEQVILGCSHLVFADSGRISVHRDYWDAAEELYEKLPLIGSLMRWLKRRVA